MNKQLFEDLANKIGNTLPPLPNNIKAEIEQSIRTILHSSFDKLDLVTREDFEIQSAVLQKTRIKLELLEKKLTQLETDLNIK